MKPLEQALFVIVLGCCLSRQAMADIYAYTADDGSVFLSNVPTEKQYKVLIKSQQDSLGEGRGPPPAPLRLANKSQYDPVIEEIARANGLDSALLHAVIAVESHYNPKAVSKKGAMGMMQLMPETAKRYGVANTFDPVQNIQGGAKYLRDLLGMFNSDLNLALAAYNAGENTVAKYGNRIPPIRETMNYVPRVLGFYRKYQAVRDGGKGP